MEAIDPRKGTEVFRRRRETEALDEDFADLDDPRSEEPVEVSEYGEDVVHPSAESAASRSAHASTSGPWDFKDKPRDDDVPRIDLGGMRVPIPEGVELRVEAQEEVIVAAVLLHEQSQILLNAFAAPKSTGIWADVRDEIVGALKESGGSANETDGPFGPELTAQIPAEDGGLQPARFIGIDGPRWFLRGLITGAAATSAGDAALLEQAFRSVVVNRGAEAMAPRDVIPLHLPREIIEGAADEMAADGETEVEAKQFGLQERGPEITETR